MRNLLFLLILAGCQLSREQIEGELWNHDQLPAELCTEALQEFGIFRRLPCKPEIEECAGGKQTYVEYIPYCAPRIKEFLAADRVYVSEWLSKLKRPKK